MKIADTREVEDERRRRASQQQLQQDYERERHKQESLDHVEQQAQRKAPEAPTKIPAELQSTDSKISFATYREGALLYDKEDLREYRRREVVQFMYGKYMLGSHHHRKDSHRQQLRPHQPSIDRQEEILAKEEQMQPHPDAKIQGLLPARKALQQHHHTSRPQSQNLQLPPHLQRQRMSQPAPQLQQQISSGQKRRANFHDRLRSTLQKLEDEIALQNKESGAKMPQSIPLSRRMSQNTTPAKLPQMETKNLSNGVSPNITPVAEIIPQSSHISIAGCIGAQPRHQDTHPQQLQEGRYGNQFQAMSGFPASPSTPNKRNISSIGQKQNPALTVNPNRPSMVEPVNRPAPNMATMRGDQPCLGNPALNNSPPRKLPQLGNPALNTPPSMRPSGTTTKPKPNDPGVPDLLPIVKGPPRGKPSQGQGRSLAR